MTHRPKHSEKKAPSDITLKTKHGESVVLTPSKVEQWFASVEATRHPSKRLAHESPQLATRFLSRFGLKNAGDVIQFLSSPAGRSTEQLIGSEVAELMARMDNQRFQWREEEAMKRRTLAFLLMGLLYRRSARAHSLNEQIQLQIDKILTKGAEKTAENSEKSRQEMRRQTYEDMLQAYDQASKALDTHIQEKLAASDHLEARLQRLEKQGLGITTRYDSMQASIVQLEADFELPLLLDNAPSIADQTSQLSQKINEKIQELTTMIQVEQQQLTALVDRFAETEDPLDEEEAFKLRDQSIEHNMQIGALKDFLSVLSGKSQLFDAEGNPVTSFAKAEYILAKDKKIAKQDGKYYLLNADQSLNDLSIEEKEQAEQAYLRLKPEMLSVKHLVKQNREFEEAHHASKESVLLAENSQLQQHILLLVNQAIQIQAARSQILEIAQADQIAAPNNRSTAPLKTNMAPMPNHNPNASMKQAPMPTPKPATGNIANSYKHVLIMMQHRPMAEDLNRLKESMRPYQANPHIAASIPLLDKIQPGRPIPAETMRSLLTYIEQFGVSASKPNVAQAINPSPRLDNHQPHRQPPAAREESSHYSAITPFSMKPKRR